jgi:uncharacterized protein YukE
MSQKRLDPEMKARAEALSRIAAQVREAAVSEYKAKHQTEVDKAARLRALRMARDRRGPG